MPQTTQRIIAVNAMVMINAITKALYPQVAKTFRTTPSRVERARAHTGVAIS